MYRRPRSRRTQVPPLFCSPCSLLAWQKGAEISALPGSGLSWEGCRCKRKSPQEGEGCQLSSLFSLCPQYSQTELELPWSMVEWPKCNILQQTSAAILWDHCQVLPLPGDWIQTDIRDQSVFCLVKMTTEDSEKYYSITSNVRFLVQRGMAGCQQKHLIQRDTGNSHIQAALHGGLLWVTTGGTGSQNYGTSWILGSLSHYLLSWSQASG